VGIKETMKYIENNKNEYLLFNKKVESRMRFEQLLGTLKDHQIAKACFANEEWYIVRDSGAVSYCNEDGSELYGIVPLTFSNMNASYEVVGYFEG